jgi:putative transposase
MKRSRFAEGQIISILREQEARAKTTQVRRKRGISDTTLYKGKAKYGGMVRRMKPLEGREHQAEEAIG